MIVGQATHSGSLGYPDLTGSVMNPVGIDRRCLRSGWLSLSRPGLTAVN